MDNLDFVREAVKALDSKKGVDIKVIDVSGKSSFADYLVVTSGGSDRQVQALMDAVEDRFEKEGIFPKGTEGRNNTGWILMDYGDVIVNIFTEEMREKYNIENVWGDCDLLDIEVE